MTGRNDRPNRNRSKVVLYEAQGCHLCERARETLAALQADLDFELVEVGIDGNPELEARYRELIPVVEIDGQQAFVYFVQPEALRRKLERA
jgi:glutaredoxin